MLFIISVLTSFRSQNCDNNSSGANAAAAIAGTKTANPPLMETMPSSNHRWASSHPSSHHLCLCVNNRVLLYIINNTSITWASTRCRIEVGQMSGEFNSAPLSCISVPILRFLWPLGDWGTGLSQRTVAGFRVDYKVSSCSLPSPSQPLDEEDNTLYFYACAFL